MRDEVGTIYQRLRTIPLQAWTIVAGLFVVGIGNYMVIPFFALYCTQVLGLTAVQVGVLLTVRLWTQRGCALFGGVLADRYTPRRIMVLGLLLRFAGFTGIASSDHFVSLLAWTALTGIGAALYTPAGKAALVSLSGSRNKLLILSLRSTAYNVGGAIGPVVGLAGSYISYRATLIGGASLFVVVAVAIALLVPAALPGQRARRLTLREARSVLGRGRVLALCVAMLVFFAFYVQLELTLPIYADQAFSRSAVTLLFLVNAATTIALQLPLSGRIERLSMTSALTAGFGCAGVGFLLISAPLGLWAFAAGVFVFSLSELVVEPKVDSELGRIVPPALLGTGFGVASLACAIGGALGHEGGALGLPLATRAGRPEMFFVGLGIVAMICACAISSLARSAASPRSMS